jgi:hypothetical protein
MQLPPHYHQIKADEARYFAQSVQSRSQMDHSIDLRAKLKRAEHEREILLNCLRNIAAVAVDSDIRQLANEGINFLANKQLSHPYQ